MGGRWVALLALVVVLFRWVFFGSWLYDAAFVAVGEHMASRLPTVSPSSADDDAPDASYDYSRLSSWVAHPAIPSDWSDMVPPGEDELAIGSHNASVFFVHPSSYFGLEWNSPAAADFATTLVADTTGMVHAAVYNFGRVFAPRYRQMTGWGFFHRADSQQRQQAMSVALADVRRAFASFLDALPDGDHHPILLAGHSQGSMLLCEMLREGLHLRKSKHRLVAAYLLAADIHEDEGGDKSGHGEERTACGGLPLCRPGSHSNNEACLVHFNAFVREGGDRDKFLLDRDRRRTTSTLVCTNPLLLLPLQEQQGRSPAHANPGSRPLLRPWDVVRNLVQQRRINAMSALERGAVGCECDAHGALWVDFAPDNSGDGYFGTGLFPGLNLHGAESSLFYQALRTSAMQRLSIIVTQ